MKVCASCKKAREDCKCQLLICHSHEAQFGFGRYRVVEKDGEPNHHFRQLHKECETLGWGSNVKL